MLRAFKSQDVAGILRIKVTNIATEKVLVTFEIAVDKVNSGGRDYLQRQYYQGLTSTAHRDENEGLVKLKGTDLILGTNGSIAWYLKPFTGEYSYSDIRLSVVFIYRVKKSWIYKYKTNRNLPKYYL